MGKFNIESLSIPDVKLIKHQVIDDNRGTFSEIFNRDYLKNLGVDCCVFQENFTVNHRGVVRGLHCQIEPYIQDKLVRCTKGRIFDVVVDVRTNSPWFGKWISINLSEDDNSLLWVPGGFLHGFCSLVDNTVVEFKCTGQWNLAYERAVIWNDPWLNINWPLPHDEIVVSERELTRNDFSAVKNWFFYEPGAELMMDK
ncbi:dTDP-4-dehydrorhamnose 3,5-epimerase [Enterobacter asburiae]|uniref:dTDP-4-dehydrorhamnose 3,5-epimerase n=1 Tax=Scandinavium sp. UTDF21-P1B TaxID=3446379 RepID=UPI003491EA99